MKKREVRKEENERNIKREKRKKNINNKKFNYKSKN